MRKPRMGRPSPALVVAVVALVAALGGTAVAAQLNGNLLRPKSVGGGKLRQFTGGLLKKQSFGGGKIKPDTLTGFQIKEETLSTVPSARSVAGDARYNVKLGFGGAQQLATVGGLTLTAQCIQNTTDSEGQAGRDVARVLVSVGEGSAVFRGSAGSKDGGAGGLLTPATPEGERVAIEYSVPTGGSAYLAGGNVTAYTQAGGGLVAPADGGGAAINLFGAACTLHGVALQA